MPMRQRASTRRCSGCPGSMNICSGTAIVRTRSTPTNSRVVPGQNGIFLPLVGPNGRIVGIWRKKISASGLTGVAALFDDPITATGRARGEKAQRGFSRALQDYAKFLAVPLNPA